MILCSNSLEYKIGCSNLLSTSKSSGICELINLQPMLMLKLYKQFEIYLKHNLKDNYQTIAIIDYFALIKLLFFFKWLAQKTDDEKVDVTLPPLFCSNTILKLI